jgi:hypothetical protein
LRPTISGRPINGALFLAHQIVVYSMLFPLSCVNSEPGVWGVSCDSRLTTSGRPSRQGRHQKRHRSLAPLSRPRATRSDLRGKARRHRLSAPLAIRAILLRARS